MSEFRILEGDCIESMRDLPDASVDAVVTDPPYGLEFMGKKWDGADGFRRSLNRADVDRDNVFGRTSRTGPEYRAGHLFLEWTQAWARETLRVLKPGGHLLAFGGTRTYHRMACAVEDAGFEIRDQLAWIYGSGFPKSRNLDGDREGWGTALKPAQEPIVLARKPLVGTVAANVLEHGTGALNIDGCRIGFSSESDEAESKNKNRHGDFKSPPGGNAVFGDYSMVERKNYDPPGRWPANVLLDEAAAAVLDEQSGQSVSRIGKPRTGTPGEGWGIGTQVGSEYDDAGGASRFFYCAKTSSAERNAGLDGFEKKQVKSYEGGEIVSAQHPETSPGGRRLACNVHPTVKPIDLMRWLVRLITPLGGTVLDPFTGSGTTGCAAVLEDFNFIGCEREPEYVEIATARIEWWDANREGGQTDVILQAAAKRDKAINPEQIGLWEAA